MVIMVAMEMVLMVIMVDVVIMVNMVDRRGQDRTGQDKLTFKLDFPGNLCLAAFAILATFHFDISVCLDAIH